MREGVREGVREGCRSYSRTFAGILFDLFRSTASEVAGTVCTVVGPSPLLRTVVLTVYTAADSRINCLHGCRQSY